MGQWRRVAEPAGSAESAGSAVPAGLNGSAAFADSDLRWEIDQYYHFSQVVFDSDSARMNYTRAEMALERWWQVSEQQ